MAEEIEIIKIIDLDPVTEFLPNLLSPFSDPAGNTKKGTIQQLEDYLFNAPLLVNATANTPAPGNNSQQLATTQYVQNALSGLGLGNATASTPGVIRTNTTDPAPVVYLKSEVDTLNNATRAVDKGGTGATTATDARTNLQAAKSGSNADITALTALSSLPQVVLDFITALFPPGSYLDYAGSTIPNGYLECNGQAVSRTTYAALFTAIGTTYGIGNGSSTFNVPNIAGKKRIGAGTSQAGTVRTIGQTGGVETLSLGIPNMPTHNHGGGTQGMDRSLDHFHINNSIGTAGSHGHNTDTFSATNTATSGGGTQRIQTGGTGAISVFPSGDHTHSCFVGNADRSLDHLHPIALEGSGAAFGSMNPYMVTRVLIKT